MLMNMYVYICIYVYTYMYIRIYIYMCEYVISERYSCIEDDWKEEGRDSDSSLFTGVIYSNKRNVLVMKHGSASV